MTPAEEEFAYYSELGRALASWAQLERSLYITLSVFFPPDTRPILGMGFVGIQGFRSKLNFAENAITRGLAGAIHQSDWDSLVADLSTQSNMRNKLAHNITATFPENTEGRRLALSPWAGPKNSPKHQPVPGALCVRDIIKARLEFEALDRKLINFCNRILKQPEPFPKSDEQPNDPPTIQQIAAQIHEELGHPRQSLAEKRRLEDAANAAASLLNSQEMKP